LMAVFVQDEAMALDLKRQLEASKPSLLKHSDCNDN